MRIANGRGIDGRHFGEFMTRTDRPRKGSTGIIRGRVDGTLAAMEQMECYCAANPSNPSAIRRPQLMVRGELWIALLGPSAEEGIVGIGPTVEAALRAFDAQYSVGVHPPVEILSRAPVARRRFRPRPDAIAVNL